MLDILEKLKNLNGKILKIRLLFVLYEFDKTNGLARFVKQYGKLGIPELDFFPHGYKDIDLLNYTYYLLFDKNKNKTLIEKINQEISTFLKGRSMEGFELARFQISLYLDNLISMHLEFDVQKEDKFLSLIKAKQSLCKFIYNDGEILYLLLKQILNFILGPDKLSDLLAKIKENKIKPAVTFAISANGDSLDQYEDFFAQNLFTCFYQDNIYVLETRDYMKKVAEIWREDANKIIKYKLFWGLRKNGVLVIGDTSIDRNDRLLDNALDALNYAGLIVFILQTLDSALSEIVMRNKAKGVFYLADELESIYNHAILINPYIIKHTASLTTWSIPEQWVLQLYEMANNILNSITTVFLNTVRKKVLNLG